MNKTWEKNQEPEKLQSVQAAPVVEKPVISEKPAEKATPTVLLSQADAYVHERIKSQPKTREEIDVKLEEKFDINHHRLTLPKELDQFMKKYAFHWIFKKEQSISEACDVKGWVLVNRTHFPELPNHLFSVTGSIERGDLILGFMRIERAEKMRKEVGVRSAEAVKSRVGAHKGNPDFYVPSDKSEEGEKSHVIGL